MISVPGWLLALVCVGLFVRQWMANIEEARRRQRERERDKKIDDLAEMVAFLFTPSQRAQWAAAQEYVRRAPTPEAQPAPTAATEAR